MFSNLFDSSMKQAAIFTVLLFILLMVWYYRAKQPRFITYNDETTGEIRVSTSKAIQLGLSVSLVSGIVLYLVLKHLAPYKVGVLNMGNTCSAPSCASSEDDFLN